MTVQNRSRFTGIQLGPAASTNFLFSEKRPATGFSNSGGTAGPLPDNRGFQWKTMNDQIDGTRNFHPMDSVTVQAAGSVLNATATKTIANSPSDVYTLTQNAVVSNYVPWSPTQWRNVSVPHAGDSARLRATVREMIDDITSIKGPAGSSNFLVSVAELGEVKDLPAQLLGRHSVLREVLARNFKLAPSVVARRAAEHDLIWKFGIKPMISDIKAVLQVSDMVDRRLKTLIERNSRADGFVLKKHFTTPQNNVGMQGEVASGSTVTTVRCKCRARYRFNDVSQLQGYLYASQTGFTSIFEAAYALIPFSFVVDWFNPVPKEMFHDLQRGCDYLFELVNGFESPALTTAIESEWSISQKTNLYIESTKDWTSYLTYNIPGHPTVTSKSWLKLSRCTRQLLDLRTTLDRPLGMLPGAGQTLTLGELAFQFLGTKRR